jgi:hypothetical protein
MACQESQGSSGQFLLLALIYRSGNFLDHIRSAGLCRAYLHDNESITVDREQVDFSTREPEVGSQEGVA